LNRDIKDVGAGVGLAKIIQTCPPSLKEITLNLPQ